MQPTNSGLFFKITEGDELTFESVLAQALILIFSIWHAVTTIEAGSAVTRAAIHTLADGFALGEAVGQIHLLVVDGHLRSCGQMFQSKHSKIENNSDLGAELSPLPHSP